jgi:AraC family transcriptional regulator, regulatory protein of adaptative response / methylated-DNA-[protein]-cysteine methyltransferase
MDEATEIMTWGCHPTPFGECLIAMTDRGVCHLSFLENADRMGTISELQRVWASAQFKEDPLQTRPLVDAIFQQRSIHHPFTLLLKGTPFQVQVWEALLTIPSGTTVCYQDVAHLLGRPTAVRAVAHAIAENPIAFLVPCHRVIKKSGEMHRYKWGTLRKKAILDWESAF